MVDQDKILALLQTTPQSVNELLAAMSPEIYVSLKQAIELGRWEDGSRLSAQQVEHSMQLLILYEARNLPDHQRAGNPLQNDCESRQDEVQPVTIRHQDEEPKQ